MLQEDNCKVCGGCKIANNVPVRKGRLIICKCEPGSVGRNFFFK